MHLPEPIEFEWDEDNEAKNWEKHRVSTREGEQFFLNAPFVSKDSGHSEKEYRYAAMGETDSGRKLAVVFTVRNNKIRVITARDMNNKEQTNYDRQKKEDPKF